MNCSLIVNPLLLNDAAPDDLAIHECDTTSPSLKEQYRLCLT